MSFYDTVMALADMNTFWFRLGVMAAIAMILGFHLRGDVVMYGGQVVKFLVVIILYAVFQEWLRNTCSQPSTTDNITRLALSIAAVVYGVSIIFGAYLGWRIDNKLLHIERIEQNAIARIDMKRNVPEDADGSSV